MAGDEHKKGSVACLRQDDACQHVTEGEEHWVAKPISSQHVLIHKHNANVGSKPAWKHIRYDWAAGHLFAHDTTLQDSTATKKESMPCMGSCNTPMLHLHWNQQTHQTATTRRVMKRLVGWC